MTRPDPDDAVHEGDRTAMGRVSSFVAGRRGKWVVLAVWLIVLAAAGPLGGRFESVQTNEQRARLPNGTESLRVADLSRQFPSGERTPAVVVVHRDGALTSGDRDAIAAMRTGIDALPAREIEPADPPRFAPDGTAAIVRVPIRTGDIDVLEQAVTAIRGITRDMPEGLTAEVGGGAGFSADAIRVFANINTTLLLATASLVFVLLILIYRSPVFWVFPLAAVLAAEATVRAVGYALGEAGLTVTGQTAGILLVLVFGAGTDYALLLIARYREELRRHTDPHDAMGVALRRAGPSIVASCGTVALSLLCLALASVSGTRGLGILGAIGVAITGLAMVTFLPALLVAIGRRPFWPRIPHLSAEPDPIATRGFFPRVGAIIALRPRRTWILTTALLLVACIGFVRYDDGLTSLEQFRGDVESVAAEDAITAAFPVGSSTPAEVIVQGDPAPVRAAFGASPLVIALGANETGPPGTRFTVTLSAEPYGASGFAAVRGLRELAAEVAPPGETLIGGQTAIEVDLEDASLRDTLRLPPIILLVTLAVLVILLRSLVAPAILVATTILSNLTAIAVSVLVFPVIFGVDAVDPSFPLFAFIFLVALGIDYNIFLMGRVREETIAHGTRAGTLRALTATGSVITSAGIVLAGTFSVLAVLPLIPLAQVGFVVAFGVLLDALVVRTVLVPALVLDVGSRTWWPSSLDQPDGKPSADARARYP